MMRQNECLRVDVRRSSDGVPNAWTVGTRNTGVQTGVRAKDEDWIIYGMFRFDATGTQTMEARCVLKKTPHASGIAQRFFDGAASPSGGGLDQAYSIGAGTACYAEYDAFGESTGSIVCGGELCTSLMALRALKLVRTSANSVVQAWACAGGGTIVVMSSGFVGYIPPNGGTEPTLPVVGPCNTGGGSGGGGEEPGDTLDQLRWGGLLCGDSLSMFCIPGAPVSGRGWATVPDTTCYERLSSTDSTRLDSLLQHMLKPLNQIADSATRATCELAAWTARQLLAGGRIFAGKFNTPPGDTLQHLGLTQAGTYAFHIEPYVLADAGLLSALESTYHYKGELLLTVLHESMHIARPDIDHLNTANYSYPPWSHLNGHSSGGTPSPCVKW